MTKAERDELRGAVRDAANKSQKWMVIDLPALLSLLDAADERDRLREELARRHPTALAPVAEHPRKDCGACNGSGGVPGEFCGRCEGYGFEPASPPPKFGACLKRRCRAISKRVNDDYCRACALALDRK